MTEFSELLTIVGLLVALTNVVVQVVKQVVPAKFPTSILTLIVAQVLTIVAVLTYYTNHGVGTAWYSVFGAVVLGFLVAYAAMFGFDKLKDVLTKATGRKVL